MSIYSIIHTASGIPEGMESGVSTNTQVAILIGVIAVVLIVAFILFHFLYNRSRLSFNDSFLSGFFISALLIGVPGFLVSMSFANNTREDLDAAVLQNIEENYDIQDISVGSPEKHRKDEHRVPITATQNGQFIEFEAAYSGDHDLMMPVNTDVDSIAIKEGSDLEVIMSQEN